MRDGVEKHCDESVEHAKLSLEHARAAVEHAKNVEKMLQGDTKEAASMVVKKAEERAELARKALEGVIKARGECYETEKEVKRSGSLKKDKNI
jgi:hypothetical protein